MEALSVAGAEASREEAHGLKALKDRLGQSEIEGVMRPTGQLAGQTPWVDHTKSTIHKSIPSF